MKDTNVHHTHPDIVKRLRRAEGHLRSIIEMIEAERSCVDVAQQLQAVEKAVCQAKKTLIQDHIDHCLDRTAGSRSAVAEFKEIAKYL